LEGVFAGAGAISYPVYVLHVPLVGPFSHVWIVLRGHVPDVDAPWSGIAMLVSLGLLSWGAAGALRFAGEGDVGTVAA